MERSDRARVEEVRREGCRIVDVDGRPVGVISVGDEFYAINDRCPHMGASMCTGSLGGTFVAARAARARLRHGRPGDPLPVARLGVRPRDRPVAARAGARRAQDLPGHPARTARSSCTPERRPRAEEHRSPAERRAARPPRGDGPRRRPGPGRPQLPRRRRRRGGWSTLSGRRRRRRPRGRSSRVFPVDTFVEPAVLRMGAGRRRGHRAGGARAPFRPSSTRPRAARCPQGRRRALRVLPPGRGRPTWSWPPPRHRPYGCFLLTKGVV